MGAGGNLRPAAGDAHGVVAGNDAGVAAAEHAIEVARRRAPGGERLRGRAREATPEVREEFGEKRIAGLERGEAAQAQLTHEAILQRAPEAFDPTLGLGRLRLDEADAEVPQDLAELPW